MLVTFDTTSTVTLSVQVATPPANDLIENATMINSLPFSATQSTQDATFTATDPSSCGGNFPNVWYRYDAPADSALRITASAPGIGASLAIYQGSPGALTSVSCGVPQQPLTVTAGQSYYFSLSTSSVPATITFSVQVATPPANDLIGNATVIGSLPFSATQSTQDATSSATDPTSSCGGTSAANVWYRYDAPADGVLRTSASGTGIGVSLAVFQGSPGSLTQVVCSTQPFAVQAGHSYYFMLTTFGSPSSLTFSVQLGTPPANDLIGNATTIGSVPFTATQSTQDATHSDGDPSASCVFGTAGTIWYRYDAPTAQILRLSSTSNPPMFGLAIAVFQGTPGSLNQVGCSFGTQNVTVSAGETYYIMGVAPLPATVTLTVDLVDSAPTLTVPGDVTVPATTASGASVSYTVTASSIADPNPQITCAPPSGAAFPIGDTPVTCTATDALGLSSQATFTVHVLGAVQQLHNLEGAVASATSGGLRTSLTADLDDALNGVTTGKVPKACGSLTDFIGLVNAQSGKKITATTAAQLVADATRVEAVIGCKA
jgi:hypothetical protein